jgi:hypothetical protein
MTLPVLETNARRSPGTKALGLLEGDEAISEAGLGRRRVSDFALGTVTRTKHDARLG